MSGSVQQIYTMERKAYRKRFFREEGMRTYKIYPKYLAFWGDGFTEESIISSDDVKRFAKEKNMTLAEIIPQLNPLQQSAKISVDGGRSFIHPFDALSQAYRSGKIIEDYMDKSLQDMVYAEMAEDIEDLGQYFAREFLAYYLRLSPDDLIIG